MGGERGNAMPFIIKGAAAHLQDDHDIRLRVGVASAMLMRIIVARCIVRVPTVANESLDSVAATVAGASQALPAPGDSSPAPP
jgi:hypothetical protein